MTDKGKDTTPDVADRLRLIREHSGHPSQKAFALWVNIEYTVYNNYENGFPMPTPQAAKIVAKMPWITLDYIYLGKVSSPEMARSLGLLPPIEPDARTG
jgi:ribosome-binding protein aMBF1 (putative translation factor)